MVAKQSALVKQIDDLSEINRELRRENNSLRRKFREATRLSATIRAMPKENKDLKLQLKGQQNTIDYQLKVIKRLKEELGEEDDD